MVTLNKIYTRTGDSGHTALGNGVRVSKYALRVTAYGTVDETNATIGLARLHAGGETDAALARIQNDLFDLGADLCRPDLAQDDTADYPPLRIAAAQTDRLESEIDAMNKKLDPLRSFGLPGATRGGTGAGARPGRGRRAERLAVELAATEPGDVNTAAIKYLNRLSDWFFVAARVANNNGRNDVLWVPGANR